MSPAELAESLRAMHRAARAHYSPAGGLPRVSIVMEQWRLSQLIHAADALDPEPGPCDMGDICIGCTPRVGNACHGESIQANDSESK